MCKTFPPNILLFPSISDFHKTAYKQPETPINKEDAAISCVILLHRM